MTVGDAALDRTVGCPWCRHRFRPDAVLSQGAKPSLGKEEAPLATPPIPAKAAESAKTPTRPASPLEEPGPIGRPASAGGSVQAGGKEEVKVSKTASGPAEQPVPQKTPDRREIWSEVTRTAEVLPERAAAPRTKGAPAGRETSLAIPRKKVARLILTETAEPKWNLAPDGSLPNLHLEERAEDAKEKEKKRSSNPFLLIIVLSGSLLTTLLLLFVDTSSVGKGSAEQKLQARQILAAEYYSNLNPNQPLAEYQRLLREAHWAHSRGDFKREKELYRQVLLLLYAESGRDTYTGLTGSRARDQQLKELLQILLKD
ncbi:MAG: hypothetical protein ACUVTH_02905 [Thermogutta sp.]